MNIIHTNPYRIAGIFANAKQREIQRNKAKIKAYAKVGRAIEFDIDYSILDSINRSEDSINSAFSSIEQSRDKVNNALFWFVNVTPIDETAFKYLAEGNKGKAVEIWTKITDGKSISAKNYSAFNNLGTIRLLSNSASDVKRGIAAKINFIESQHFNDFVKVVADETFSIDNSSHVRFLVDEILKELETDHSTSELLSLFSSCGKETRNYLSKKFTDGPIHSIESSIEATKNSRKQHPKSANQSGLSLYNDTKDDLTSLKSLLGGNGLKYKMIADNLAKEILQCGIDYFQVWKESTDPSKQAIALLTYAKNIAVSAQVIDRAKDNIEGIKEWAETAKIESELIFITNQLERFQNKSVSVNAAKCLVEDCKPKLQVIKKVLGVQDTFYLNISGAVASNAQAMLIETVNIAQHNLEVQYEKAAGLVMLMMVVEDALPVSKKIGTLDMPSEIKARYTRNHNDLRQLNNEFQRFRGSNSGSGSSGGGCYIATMAYGDYDHPQVLKLREFRDTILQKSIMGRAFIKFYYRFSPSLVEMLKNSKRTNKFIRTLLDKFIQLISRK
ncbi:CFI-box-CTERM domain-containing protein [Aureispira sp. CCB-E]|uniref:CFI-box-CTERM domain-containing protein n=1 Tax=Aureispira sp. CCB-E TaxID=3051121 RepID=UPI002868B7C0|nr:CFI-box-CTERM domain-containing protein [Aureispira sp. CCB-E]WMX16512.1 CFI-box-CTERM domain-containing protein [Aureispira sp. CCB-E]